MRKPSVTRRSFVAHSTAALASATLAPRLVAADALQSRQLFAAGEPLLNAVDKAAGY